MSSFHPLVDPGTFERQLGIEIERARRYRHSLGLAILRLDQYDPFLEQGGKESQTCLAQVAETMRKNTRSSDLAGRHGHNALIVLFPETDLEAASKACEKLRGEVLKLSSPHADVQLTISCGVTAFPEFGETAEALVTSAEACFRKAHAMGGNIVVGAHAAEVSSR